MRWLIVLALGLTTCGSRAFIDVAVQSSRVIPDEVDRLLVTVTDEAGNEVGRADYVPSGAFPQHVILEPSKNTGTTLDIAVEARLGETLVANGSVRVTWREDATTNALVALDSAQGGQLDTLFGSSGRLIEVLGSNDLAWDTALLPDGGMIIAGNARLTSIDVGVMKINANGGDDPDFGDDATGHITLPSAGDEQTCGVIIVGDTMTITGSRGTDDYYTQTYAARVSLGGELDTTFGVGGVFLHDVATPNSASNGDPHAIGQEFVCQSFDDGNGAVLMSGHARFADADGRDLILMRMVDGVLDTSFASNGIARIDLGSNDRVWRAAHRDTHGRVVMCAMLGLDPGPLKIAVARVTPDGVLDASFAGIGYIVFPDAYPFQECQGAFVDANERVLVTGYTPAGNGDMFIRRLLDDGTPDASFGVDGLVQLDIGGGQDRANDIQVDALGRVVVVGQARIDSQTDMAILRLLDDGSLDPRFGMGGIATFDVGGQQRSDIANSIEIDQQGRIYAIGTSQIMAAGVARNVFSGVRVLP